MMLVIKVIEIKGKCPVYEPGDRIVLREGYILDPGSTGGVCMHSLASLLPYYVALSRGVKSRDLGLSREGSEECYVQCLDPCEITGGGTVRFEISRVEEP
ncbi:MAG: TIGR04076 family protein [Deltaproteobacteria bacterium]|nr:TIGR04076 family protein [Deltaproteobacteria bacterium]MBW2120248.1 TIGR04076 family protein [Deltaproteobacteria bacterium]